VAIGDGGDVDVLGRRITPLRLTFVTSKGRRKNSLAESRATHDAIREGDPDRVQAACVKHIEEAATVALRVLASTEADAAVDA
jgi:GntR family transcriptional regulator, trigonelline degradation regulator